MFERFFKGRRNRQAVRERGAALAAAAIRQARDPALYRQAGVPDTVDGRFDAVALHAWLVLRPLRAAGEAGKAVAQAFTDALFADFDGALRELGTSDVAVSKRMKDLAGAFYGRLAAYDTACEEDSDTALAEALKRNVYRKTPVRLDQVQCLAAYVRAQLAAIEALPAERLAAGEVTFEPLGAALAAPPPVEADA